MFSANIDPFRIELTKNIWKWAEESEHEPMLKENTKYVKLRQCKCDDAVQANTKFDLMNYLLIPTNWLP